MHMHYGVHLHYTSSDPLMLFLLGDFLNELSNDGARAQFEKYLQKNLLHAMVQCAQVSLWLCLSCAL